MSIFAFDAISHPPTAAAADKARSEAAAARTDALRGELHSLIAGECVMCGDAMVRSIDAPFVDPSEHEEIDSWRI